MPTPNAVQTTMQGAPTAQKVKATMQTLRK
jgi:hypothetical protein